MTRMKNTDLQETLSSQLLNKNGLFSIFYISKAIAVLFLELNRCMHGHCSVRRVCFAFIFKLVSVFPSSHSSPIRKLLRGEMSMLDEKEEHKWTELGQLFAYIFIKAFIYNW